MRKRRTSQKSKSRPTQPPKPSHPSPPTPPVHQMPQFRLTQKQKKLIHLANDINSKIIFISGPAGTSKSFCSIWWAVTMCKKNAALQVKYIRSVVESSDRSMGFQPGTAQEKLSYYLGPMYDKLHEISPPETVKWLIDSKTIEGSAVNFARGASWTNKIIIVDEAQNLTSKEIYTLMTRMGEGSKMFILGDPTQSDIQKSGFVQTCQSYDDDESRQRGIHYFEFNEDDIVRSELVKYIIKKNNQIKVF